MQGIESSFVIILSNILFCTRVCVYIPAYTLRAGAVKGLKHITNSWADLSRMALQRLTGITIRNVLLSFFPSSPSSLTPSHKGESLGYSPDSETPCFDFPECSLK